jgi:hypothetical protein
MTTAGNAAEKQRSATAAAGAPILAESQTPTRPIAQSKTSVANGSPCSGTRPVQFGIAVSRKPATVVTSVKLVEIRVWAEAAQAQRPRWK